MSMKFTSGRSTDSARGRDGARRTKWLALSVLVAAILIVLSVFRPAPGPTPTLAAQAQGLSLVTPTPDEGFALAVTLSRRGVTTTQPDREVLHELRPEYASDADALIASSHVIAVYFQTIAEANNYWRD